MQKIFAMIMLIYVPSIVMADGFGGNSLTNSNDGSSLSTSTDYTDTPLNTKSWYENNGTTSDQPTANGYTSSDPTPDCPTTGIYLKNNSPRQETFMVTFIDGSQNVLSILPNDTRCIHTTNNRKIQNISVSPFLGPEKASASNGSASIIGTDFNGSGDSSNFNSNDSSESSTPAQLPSSSFTQDQIKNHTKSFSQFFKDTLYYPLASANKICRTLTYSGYTLQCWQANPNLTPLYTMNPAIIIPTKNK